MREEMSYGFYIIQYTPYQKSFKIKVIYSLYYVHILIMKLQKLQYVTGKVHNSSIKS
jgi:hypothetical protein